MREKRKTGSAFKVILVGQNRIIPHIEPVWDHSVTAADLMCFMFENIDMLRDDDIVMRETLLARMDDINKNADTSKSTQNIQEIIRHFVSRVENSAAKNIQDQWDPLVAWQSLITAEPDDYGPIRDEEFPSGYMEQHHQYRNVTDTGTINPLRIDSHPVDDLLPIMNIKKLHNKTIIQQKKTIGVKKIHNVVPFSTRPSQSKNPLTVIRCPE
jgi:hypothetical protein